MHDGSFPSALAERRLALLATIVKSGLVFKAGTDPSGHGTLMCQSSDWSKIYVDFCIAPPSDHFIQSVSFSDAVALVRERRLRSSLVSTFPRARTFSDHIPA